MARQQGLVRPEAAHRSGLALSSSLARRLLPGSCK